MAKLLGLSKFPLIEISAHLTIDSPRLTDEARKWETEKEKQERHDRCVLSPV